MLKLLLEFKPRDVPWMVGLRNTAAVALPLAMGVASGHPGVGLGISAGALNTMFSDQPGPYRLRLRRMHADAGDLHHRVDVRPLGACQGGHAAGRCDQGG